MEACMSRDVLTSFLDGFAMAGFSRQLRRRGAPTSAFAPSRKKEKIVLVIDDDLAAERLEHLRQSPAGQPGESYSLVEAEIYIQDRYKVG
jgi:hypothetical protein